MFTNSKVTTHKKFYIMIYLFLVKMLYPKCILETLVQNIPKRTLIHQNEEQERPIYIQNGKT
jgi:hypothetical protein